MMLYVVIGFLWVSLLIYLLTGGADYGAGIIELFSSRKQRNQVKESAHHIMGPIWEANHMWLIIAVVVLFVGFPQIYTTVSVYLHIPLLIMLFGIIARGTSFTFRNYDAVKDHWQRVYDKVYIYSSFITPFFLGIIAASAVSGHIDSEAISFSSTYIFSWLNWFSVFTGFFTVSLCGFLASVFLLGEVKEQSEKKCYINKARMMALAMFICIIMLFISALYDRIPLANWIFGSWFGVGAVCCSIISFVYLWITVSKDKIMNMRISAGFMVTDLLAAGTYTHYPNIILLKNGSCLSLLDHKGGLKTIEVLGWALLIGSIFIIPALLYLLYIFDRKAKEKSGEKAVYNF